MKTFRELAFQKKLTLLMTLTSASALLLAGLVLLSYEVRRSVGGLESDLRAIAGVVGANSTAALAFNDRAAAEENLASLSLKPFVESACLYTASGRPLAVYHRVGSETDWNPAGPEPEGFRIAESHAVLFEDVLLQGERVGALYVKADIGELRDRVGGYALTVLVVMLLATAAAWSLATRLQRTLSRPIVGLTAAARAVEETGDYSVRVPEESRDELGVLSAAFNRMLARIAEQNAALRAARDQLEERVQERVHDLRREMEVRLRVEEALRGSERKFRSIVETTSDCIWATDAQARVTYHNPAVTRVLGYARGELVGRNALELLHPEDRGHFEAMLPDFVKRKTGWCGLVLRVRHKDGSYRYLESSATAIVDPRGRLAGFQGSDHDITEHRALEEQLRQSQKMEAVGRLAGGVAHDFNNLLGVILGYADLLLRKDPQAAYAGKVEQMRKAADRAAGLTRQLLAFSRKQVLDLRLVDPNTVLADLGSMLTRLIGEDIRLEIVTGHDLGRVRADVGQMEQVLMNLAVNARDAMPKGGLLRIETSNADVDAAMAGAAPELAPGSYVMLSVSDTGCGMDAETRSHIFEPFFTTKEKGKGTGLGLATAYGIVKQSGGHVTVSSAPDQGTTFRIYLPRVEPEPEARSEAAAPVAALDGSKTVLLVEDEAALRQLTSEILRVTGHDVLEARHGREALEVAAAHRGPIHVLLTDVVMPEMGGPELARRLAPLHPEMRVVYMSGYTDDALGRRGVLERGTRLLHKPFTQDGLWRILKEALADGPRKG